MIVCKLILCSKTVDNIRVAPKANTCEHANQPNILCKKHRKGKGGN